jgi:putative transcriptional regulator
METRLAPGFLAATPPLRDSNFQRALVLLVEHGAEGALGFIVNQPGETALASVLEELELPIPPALAERIAFVGGPVSPDTGWIVYDPTTMRGEAEEETSAIAVNEHLAVSASRDVLEAIAHGRGPERALFLFGYAGWGPGQLEGELEQGAWIPLPLDTLDVFAVAPDAQWARALGSIGIDPARYMAALPKA